MKVTQSHLKRVIKEELQAVLKEDAKSIMDTGLKTARNLGMGGGPALNHMKTVVDTMQSIATALAQGETGAEDRAYKFELSRLQKGMQKIHLMFDQIEAGTANFPAVVEDFANQLVTLYKEHFEDGDPTQNPQYLLDAVTGLMQRLQSEI